MIGAFYQPRAVVIDTATLATLPSRELSAGLAEVIKYGLICDEPFLTWLEANIDRIRSLDSLALTEAIHRSCAAKAKVVNADERESGVRATLNLGHTFGHAIETHMGYGVWLHGEAVSAGTVMALEMSSQLGWIGQADRDRAIRLCSEPGCRWCLLPRCSRRISLSTWRWTRRSWMVVSVSCCFGRWGGGCHRRLPSRRARNHLERRLRCYDGTLGSVRKFP